MFSTHEYNTTNSAKLFHDGCAAGGFMKCCYSNCNNWNGLLIIPCVRKCFWHGHSTPSRAMTYVGPCCYTSSPFSCGLFFFLLPLDVCVYITRCAICVYLNYLNIYPGYQLFFSPLPFFFLKNNNKKKDWTDWGDVSDRLWRLWCSGILRIVYIRLTDTNWTELKWLDLKTQM